MGKSAVNAARERHIYIALGANLESRFGSPLTTLEQAILAIENKKINVLARSRWYACPAYPDPSEPEFVNGVIAVECNLTPMELLSQLHEIERDFGRERRRRWAPRILDLDVIDYRNVCLGHNPEAGLVLPHPRLVSRDFVLLPLRDVAPDWVHPQSGKPVHELIAALETPILATPIAGSEILEG